MFGRLGLHLNFSVAHAKIPDSRNTQKEYLYVIQLHMSADNVALSTFAAARRAASAPAATVIY